MRFSVFALAALASAMVALPAFSKSVPLCRGVNLVSPANGSHFIGSRPIMFRWSGEPAGTVSRELHLAALDGTETVIPLDGRFSDTVKVKMNGDLGWVVVFLDAKGKPLCTTSAGLLASGLGGGKVGLAGSSLIESQAAVSIFMRNGRLVIVLQNSQYTGPYTRYIASDNYDGTNEDLMGAVGIELYGNNARNVVVGTSGSDEIHLYGGNDTAEGGAGDDAIYSGSGNDTITDRSPLNVNDQDTLYLGSGNKSLRLDDGDTLDKIFVQPDTLGGGIIDGGEFDVTILPVVPE